MGCSGSKGASATKKFDDNKALREEGLAELTPAQIKAMNPLWKIIVDSIKNKTEMALLAVMSQEESRNVAKAAFEKADADMDSYLNAEEGAAFFNEVGENEDAAKVKAYCDAAVSLSDKAGHFKWEDFERVFASLNCWVKNGKAKAEIMTLMKKEMAKMPKEQREMMQGMMEMADEMENAENKE